MPNLFKIALKYLTTLASSVASERAASTLKLCVPNARSRLTYDNSKKRVVLKTPPDKYWNLWCNYWQVLFQTDKLMRKLATSDKLILITDITSYEAYSFPIPFFHYWGLTLGSGLSALSYINIWIKEKVPCCSIINNKSYCQKFKSHFMYFYICFSYNFKFDFTFGLL